MGGRQGSAKIQKPLVSGVVGGDKDRVESPERQEVRSQTREVTSNNHRAALPGPERCTSQDTAARRTQGAAAPIHELLAEYSPAAGRGGLRPCPDMSRPVKAANGLQTSRRAQGRQTSLEESTRVLQTLIVTSNVHMIRAPLQPQPNIIGSLRDCQRQLEVRRSGIKRRGQLLPFRLPAMSLRIRRESTFEPGNVRAVLIPGEETLLSSCWKFDGKAGDGLSLWSQ